MTYTSPFHIGELKVQQLAGEQSIATKVGKIIQPKIPNGALNFLRQQSILWLGVEDQENQPWAFPLFGSPSFINPTNGELLKIDLRKSIALPKQWYDYLKKSKNIGSLAIELSSRRRLRINGTIQKINKQQLHINVKEAYPNCPKYIRKREMLGKIDFSNYHFLARGNDLDTHLHNIIHQSDTAFVVSIGPNGADLSHRGGEMGFIKVTDKNKLLMPDYTGNSMFNTLGNFKTNPLGGLLIIDFNQGLLLQLSGKINLFFNTEHPKFKTGGTNRYWEMTVKKWELFQLMSNLRWENLDFSPHNP